VYPDLSTIVTYLSAISDADYMRMVNSAAVRRDSFVAGDRREAGADRCDLGLGHAIECHKLPCESVLVRYAPNATGR
jgi:hypothetical protein